MADFCFQCTVDMFFTPPGDLAGLCEEGQIVNVICEGCGCGVWVDYEGWCVTSDCPEHGDMAPGRAEVYERAYRWWRRRSGLLGPLLRLRDRVLGSLWEPGEIHFDGRWAWWYNLYRSIRDGEPLYKYLEPPELTLYDLELGTKFIYPVFPTLRNELPNRPGGGGVQATWVDNG